MLKLNSAWQVHGKPEWFICQLTEENSSVQRVIFWSASYENTDWLTLSIKLLRMLS